MNVPKLRFKEFNGEWEEYTFRDITKLSQGLQIAISNRFLEGGDNREFYITNEFLNPKSQKKYYIENPPKNVIANEEDILMTRTGNTGKVVTNVRGAFHNNFFKVAYDSNNIYKLFLYYLLNSKPIQKEILVRAGTSTIPDLNHNDFYRIKINLPNKEEQNKIGIFVENLENRIQLQQQKIDLLQEQKKGFLQKMFPKVGETQPEIRLNGFIGNWKVHRFEDNIISIQTGTNLLGSDTNKGIPLVKMGNIQRGYFTFNKLEYLDEKENIEKENIISYGDFLFNTRNTLELVGKGATWIGKSGEYAFNNNIARFTFSDIDTIFFNYLYNTQHIISQVHARAVGTTSVAAVYPRDLNSIVYCLPSIEEQKRIGEFFKKLDTIITLQQEKLKLLQKQKKGFMQQMFI